MFVWFCFFLVFKAAVAPCPVWRHNRAGHARYSHQPQPKPQHRPPATATQGQVRARPVGPGARPCLNPFKSFKRDSKDQDSQDQDSQDQDSQDQDPVYQDPVYQDPVSWRWFF